MTPCSPLAWVGVIFVGSAWTSGRPEWVPGYVDACTHTPLPYAHCAPRVGGFRTREDERRGGAREPCRYGRRLDFRGEALYFTRHGVTCERPTWRAPWTDCVSITLEDKKPIKVSRRVGWVQVFRHGKINQTYSIRRVEEYTTEWDKGRPTSPPVRVALAYGDRWRRKKGI